MRNKYPGTCYRCGRHCGAGEGHFERYRGGWRVQHAICAIEARASDEITPENREERIEWLRHHALKTGKKAQRARRQLREMGIKDGEE